MGASRRIRVGVIGAVIAVLAGFAPAVAQATTPGLTGKITGPSTLDNVIVSVFNNVADQTPSAQTLTDASGTFTFPGVAISQGLLFFHDPAGRYADTWAGNPPPGTNSNLTTTVFASNGPITQQMIALGALAGKLTGTGATLDGITLDLWTADPNVTHSVVRSTTTDATGSFSFVGLVPGSYSLNIVDPQNRWVGQWYGQASPGAATPVYVVQSGKTLTLTSQPIIQYGAVHGTVSIADGSQVGGMHATVWTTDQKNVINFTTIAPDGSYSIGQIPPGTYNVAFSDPAHNVASQFYKGKSVSGTPDAVVVTAGSDTDLGNDALLGYGSVSGVITADGNPLSFTQVCVDTLAQQQAGCAYTAADGSYTVGHVAAGSANIVVLPVTPWLDYSYANGVATAATHQVAVETGKTSTAATINLIRQSSLTGRLVTDGVPLADVSVRVYPKGGSLNNSFVSYTNYAGYFAFNGMIPGTYEVQFTPSGTSASYLSRWYGNTMLRATSTDVVAAPGAAVDLGDTALPLGATINVTLTHLNLPNDVVYATALDANGNPAASALVGLDGTAALVGLEAGTYVIKFAKTIGNNPQTPYYYPGVSEVGSALPVTVTAGQTIGINPVSASTTSTVSGSIKGFGGSTLDGVTVTAYGVTDGSTSIVQATTDATGKFTMYGIDPGTYAISYTDDSAQRFSDQWYVGEPTIDLADLVTVGKDANVTIKPVTLVAAGAALTATPPGAPTRVVASVLRSGIKVVWTAPTHAGGAVLASYTASLFKAKSGGKALGVCRSLAKSGNTPATTCTLKRPKKGTYYVSVIATNAGRKNSAATTRIRVLVK